MSLPLLPGGSRMGAGTGPGVKVEEASVFDSCCLRLGRSGAKRSAPPFVAHSVEMAFGQGIGSRPFPCQGSVHSVVVGRPFTFLMSTVNRSTSYSDPGSRPVYQISVQQFIGLEPVTTV